MSGFPAPIRSSMASCLTPLHDVIDPVLATCGMAPAVRLPVAQALGFVLGETLVTPCAVPSGAIALRPGLAVRSLDTVGASAHSPVMLMSPPASVEAGDGLPPGCDAVIDRESGMSVGIYTEICGSVAPGCHVRFAGHDLHAGAVLAETGTRVTPELVLACRIAGIRDVSVRRLPVVIEIADAGLADWLVTRLGGLGCMIVSPDHDRALLLRDAGETWPRLALRPGETGWLDRPDDRLARIDVPRRFDGLIAVYAALILPVVAGLLGQKIETTRHVLRRKTTSAIGTTDLALFREVPGGLEPTGVGDIPLGALTGATHLALLPPEVEGFDAGALLETIPLARPLSAPDRKP
jgi:molybdopterin molybdotransferase